VPLLAAVGPLQFEVVQYRMQTEYGADSRLEQGSWKVLRWVAPTIKSEDITDEMLPTGARVADDGKGNLVILFTEDWTCQFFAERNPKIPLSTLPFDAAWQDVASAKA